jgi:hypothetical protein
MLPEDTDWFANDGAEEITHDWTNAVELGVDVGQASENAANIFPVKAGTTLAWGGVRMLFIRSPVINAGADWIADDTIDWRNRWILCLDTEVDADEADIAGEANYVAAGTHEGTTDQASCAFWTGAGAVAGSPPTGNYGTPIGGMHVYCNSADNKLTIRNSSGGNYYAFMVLMISDQFKTRLP